MRCFSNIKCTLPIDISKTLKIIENIRELNKYGLSKFGGEGVGGGGC
jgi:hypothetical protein